MRIGFGLKAIAALMVLMASPHMCEQAVQGQNNPGYLKRGYIRLKGGLKDLSGNKTAMAGGILTGIMVMIIGFATLTIGNYIVFAILSSLPPITGTYATNYTATTNTLVGYVTTVLPIFGLGLMVLGFGIILWTLRASMGQEVR